MTAASDADLYHRGVETLLGSWEEYARGASRAVLRRRPGVAAALFPDPPERSVYNNALLEFDLGSTEREAALEAMEAAYDAAGISCFAAWIHESDRAMRKDVERRGYVLDASTRAMGMSLDDIRLPRPDVDLGAAEWVEYLRIIGVPATFLARVDRSAFHIRIARLDGVNVAAAMAFDLGTDRGIFNVTTETAARRRGLGTALTLTHLYDARDRGCRTATLQSTAMAERLYAAIGFRDLGRILEYVPGTPSRSDGETHAQRRVADV